MFSSSTREVPTTSAVPRHVAIIMDGNGRWAKQRMLPRVAGHRRGVEAVRAIILACIERDIEYLTLFAFSSIVFLLPYLLMFPAFLVLRRRDADRARPYRVPGRTAVVTLMAAVCWLFVFGGSVLFFKPAPGGDPAQAVRESFLLGMETLATVVVGLALLPRRGVGVSES